MKALVHAVNLLAFLALEGPRHNVVVGFAARAFGMAMMLGGG